MLTQLSRCAARVTPRAMQGDPTAIGILAAIGAAALVITVIDHCKSQS